MNCAMCGRPLDANGWCCSRPLGFVLLLAVSADGYLARSERDNMRWTGGADKALFRLLTLASPLPLLAGRTTAEQMPPLPGREVVALSRSGLTLHEASRRYPGAYLIGGPTVAREAIAAGLVSRAVLSRCAARLEGGISALTLGSVAGVERKLITLADGLVAEVLKWPAR